MEKANIEWGKLGFAYVKTDKRFICHWKEGKWDEGKLVADNFPFIGFHQEYMIYAWR